MVTKVRTIDFLPEIFKTKTNEQFLRATLDQLTQQPDIRRIEGFIGSKFGYGVNVNDKYLVEPDQVRTNYQLDPAVVFKKKDTDIAVDVLTYPGLIDAIKLENGLPDNNDSLFSNEFYSWDSFCDLDKVINYSQYYWLPFGPEAVTITNSVLYKTLTYNVISEPTDFRFSANEVVFKQQNPVLTLIRGGTYTFKVDQSSPFWIQTAPGLSGYDVARKNQSSREIYGVTNNGTSLGEVVFEVPYANAQDNNKYPGNIDVDIVCTSAFNDINGKLLSNVKTIDGVRLLEGKTVIFYGTAPGAIGLVSVFYGEGGLGEYYEETVPSEITKHYYKINYLGTGNDTVIKLTEEGLLPDNTQITIRYGDTYIGKHFVKNSYGEISLIPPITAELDTFYYQDGENSEKVGVIKLIDSVVYDTIDVNTIIGQKYYTGPNNIEFTNGLKIQFQGQIVPESYANGQYYVEGVGTSIQLIPTTDLDVPESFSQAVASPFDGQPYDQLRYGDSEQYPIDPDYITISRLSLDKNAWSRSNRWFHIDVLQSTIDNTLVSPLATEALGNPDSRAKRPIIEFYPNLKMFNAGSVAKPNTNFINFTATDAFTQVAGQTSFEPDGPSSYLYNGATIIFAGDTDVEVRNKIYVVEFSQVTPNTEPVITLSVAPDGYVSYNEQTVILQGETAGGVTYWFDGLEWHAGQLKERVNQPPTFDVFDYNGVSFGDDSYYPSSTFTGCTLFEYAPTTGTNDTVLGFPIKYSSVNNLGDITFNVSLNNQTFNYVQNSTNSVTASVGDGYVYNYSSRTDYIRALGWQTAVADSFQYQVFNFKYVAKPVSPTFVLDVKVTDQDATPWPVLVVYVNNSRVESSVYTVTTTDTTTTITLVATPPLDTPIDIMVYSEQASKIGYYQTPSNLDHNPFNEEINEINLGDIRGHYKSMCNNAPNFIGDAFGSNNFRDLGNLVPYGTRIIQNSAPVNYAAAFLKTGDNNIFDALTYNGYQYANYKAKIIDTVVKTDFEYITSVSGILDEVLDIIGSTRLDSGPFFYGDMVPSKNAYITNTYTFKSNLDTSVFKLSRIYDFNSANYYGILVYLTRKVGNETTTTQLLRTFDYDVSETTPNLTVYTDLITGDIITVKEYYQTYGSFVPNTPTKLGLYPRFKPQVVYDETYVNPTYFIKGHDGSLSKLYGAYENGTLVDLRDKVLFEFECRVFNNIKVNAALPVAYDEVVPGYFRDVGISFSQYNDIYATQFLNWVGANRVDYTTNRYSKTNPWTYNYKGSTYNIDKQFVQQGNWRGVYLYLYDTCNPDTAPWEMLGLSIKPTWWDSHYGVAPYTSDNEVMWQDIADGLVYNNGQPYVNTYRIRNGLMDMLPVDTNGNLVDPFTTIIGSYDSNAFGNPWTVGDMGPTEYAYRTSSTWPFDLMRLMALTKPAKFFSLGIDLDTYKYNEEFNQYLVSNRFRITPTDLTIYGQNSETATNSYTAWIVDYLNQYGLDGAQHVYDLLVSTDVRLVYRLAGFSDKDLLNFFVEKGSTNSTNNSLMIPDDSYTILLYENQPNATITYSSVIVQLVEGNLYKVYGNSQTKNYFIANNPIYNGTYDTITVNNLSVKIPKTYYSTTRVVPYGITIGDLTDLCEFLRGYGLYLQSLGMQFNDIENGLELNWDQMIAETVYWSQTGWEVGSTINVNPSSRVVSIDKGDNIVQPLTFQKQNFVLNQNLLPISISNLFIDRKDTLFSVKALNLGDSISLMKANLSSIEHVVVFDNETIFNDVIYNTITGLRQQRIFVRGSKTSQWNGTIDAAGYILNQDNIVEWQENVKYTKGTIVKYKNRYYIANKSVIIPTIKFDYNDWDETAYDQIQKGLLPNPSTRAYESSMFYDTSNPNLENDADLLSFSLIGFRPRQYFADANFTDATQVNLYKNMIPVKGTVDSVTRLQGINLQQNQLNYSLHENWAIKTSEYGGLLNQNFVEFTLNQSALTGNPSIVGITNGNKLVGVQQEIPLYKIKNYARPISDANIFPTISYNYQEKLPSAGYVNLDDVIQYGYTLDNLPDNSINEVFKNDYLYVADKDNTWQIYTPYSTGALVTKVLNNLNGTATVTFNKAHGYYYNQAIGILNFDSAVDGYYLVTNVIDTLNLTIPLNLGSSAVTYIGSGLSFLLQSQRVITARDMDGLPLLNADYTKNRVWVDENVEGSWTVYEKTNNYSFELLERIGSASAFGTSVAYVPNIGYFVGDSAAGKVYHYAKTENDLYYLRATISHPGTEFGYSMTYENDLLIISDPDPTLSRIYIYKIPTASNINSIVLQEVLSIGGARVGESIALSGDGNWLYLGASGVNTIIQFQRAVVPSYTSASIQLASATVVNNKYFVATGDVLSLLSEGQEITFLTSYTDLNMVLATPTIAVTTRFDVEGDQTSKLAYGDQVSFDNSGTQSAPYNSLKTVTSSYYDPMSDITRFFTIEEFEDNEVIPAGTSVYKVAFNESTLYTIVTGTYDSDSDTTTFYVNEKIDLSAPSGSFVYIVRINFQLAGLPLYSDYSNLGAQYGFSLATNYDGSKLFVGSPQEDYNNLYLNTGVVYCYDRITQNVELQYDQNNTYIRITLGITIDRQARVYANGVLLSPKQYFILLNYVYLDYSLNLYAGDIITVSGAQWVNTYRLAGMDNPSDLRQGELFGYSVATNKYGSEMLAGSPFDVSNSTLKEGAVLRFTDESKRYGTQTGAIGANLYDPVYILINGFRVTLAPQSVNAGSFVVGYDGYTIETLGTTNWYAIGATSLADLSGSISGTTLTVSAAAGRIYLDTQLSGGSVTPGTLITAQLTSTATLAASKTGSGTSGSYILYLSSTTGIDVGLMVSGTNVPAGTYVQIVYPGIAVRLTSALTGAASGTYQFRLSGYTGTYTVSISQSVSTSTLHTNAVGQVFTPTGVGSGTGIARQSARAALLAQQINTTNIDNVFAYATEDGRLVIRLLDKNLGNSNNKLNITPFNGVVMFQLGFQFPKSQVISDPHEQTKTQFGYNIQFNNENSFVVSAPANTRYLNTTFDFIDDADPHNDTVFDNNLTGFVDKSSGAGSVYMYDYIQSYDESVTNIGKYVYAQACNDLILDYGISPMYGQSLSFNDNVVMIGAPNFKEGTINGRVVTYFNTSNESDWHVYRASDPIVNIDKIQKVELYDNTNDNTLISTDYIDPLQGKLLGVVRENIDFISSGDPAGYNGPNINKGNRVWVNDKLGTIWFDTTKVRFLNYHQNDVEYNSKYWGAVFPGSDVAVYTWIESDVVPALYTGPGTPYDYVKYSVVLTTDANNSLYTKYYYWVRNTNTLFTLQGKTITDTIIERYISDPRTSGISYFAPLRPDTFALYNTQEFINNVNTNIHIGFSTGSNDTSGHIEFQLIRSDYPDDFLYGFPNPSKGITLPYSLYDRMIDSFSGTDERGALVPDPYIPKLLQTGINTRPRQSFFINRLEGIRNYLEYANNVIAHYPINEFGNITFLTAQGLYFNTSNYWENIYWWAEGYSSSTRAVTEVPTYTDLLTITPKDGLIVGVSSNAQGKREVYAYTNNNWERIGLQDGTIRFLSSLWDYQGNNLGFGDSFYDSTPYDSYPTIETRYIIRALNEQIYVGPLFEHRNKSLILLFEYITSENIESQNYLPWLNKTSFADVSYTVRELTTNQKFQRDNESLLEGYINEIKPYHVVMKQFFLEYTKTDLYQGFITDFDVPATFNPDLGRFISPQLVDTQYTNGYYEYNTQNSIWQESQYVSWYNNYGLYISDISNTSVCVLAKFVSTLDNIIYVDNAEGMPVTGVIKIEDELIGYTSVDRSLKTLTGVSRGVEGTIPTAHYAGQEITMDQPGIVVLNTGYGYQEVPEITVIADPAPKRPAVLEPVMSDDRVISVNVIDPGEGYVTTPEIVFSASITYTIPVADINSSSSSLQVETTELTTGQEVYSRGIEGASNTIIPDGYYYIRAIDVQIGLFSLSNAKVITFHRTLQDSISGFNRVQFIDPQTITGIYLYYEHYLDVKARAIPSMVSNKVRSIKPVLRFDRTSYQPRVQDWVPNEFYSATYLSIGNDASSSTKLFYTQSYDGVTAAPVPSGGSGATFIVYNILLGGDYYVEIKTEGVNYNVNDVITIPGTTFTHGQTPLNDCVITVTAVGVNGEITDVSVPGWPSSVAPDPSLASLAGATLPILSLSSVNGNAVVTVDYGYSGLSGGQVRNSYMYFYRVHPVYVYDDSLGGGAILNVSRPQFNPFSLSNQYLVQIVDPGSIYADGDVIIIKGSDLGGVDDINDCKITITYVDLSGGIYRIDVSGISVGEFARYYVKPISTNELAIYEDSTLRVPVSYSAFMWNGAYSTDYGYLPEPITTNYAYGSNVNSIVSYAGYIWQCLTSNNDSEFDPTKWYPLQSSDVALNALDRIQGYYAPTIDMPGKDIKQLLQGVTYPNTTYYGNSFAPEDELPLDILLQDQPFTINDISIVGITYDGTKKIALANTSNRSLILVSNESGTWSAVYISDELVSLNATSITYSSANNGQYFITTLNTLQSLMISSNGESYITFGQPIGFSTLEYDFEAYDSSNVSAPQIPYYKTISVDGVHHAVGSKIVRSIDGVNWEEVYALSTRLENYLIDIAYVTIPGFTGYITVGKGYDVAQDPDLETPVPNIIEVGRVVISPSGEYDWTLQQPSFSLYPLYGVIGSSDGVVVVGGNASIFYSENASNWVAGSISGPAVTTNIRSVAYGNGLFIAVGDKTGTADSDPGLILTSNDGLTWTQQSSASITTNNLTQVYYNSDSSVFYIVGDNQTILETYAGVVFSDLTNLQVNEPYYTVKGNDFLYGYGPEELVAGVTYDNLSMFVRSAPGAYWDLDDEFAPVWYYHTGFNMVTKVGLPDLNYKISFANVVVNPARLSVFIVDDVTNEMTRIYEDPYFSTTFPYNYTVDWLNQTITLYNQDNYAGADTFTNPSLLDPVMNGPSHILIEVYEVGNGKELVRGNSKLTPLFIDERYGTSAFLFAENYEYITDDPGNGIYKTLVYIDGVKMTRSVDYDIVISINGELELLFDDVYDPNVNYIVYSISGDVSTVEYSSSYQYGYSIPETQTFVVTDPSQANFTIDDTLTLIPFGTNSENSIVEINGVRLIPPGLDISDAYSFPDSVTLTLATAASQGDVVSITTFYDTHRQWMTSALYENVSNFKVTSIYYINNSTNPVQVTFNSDPLFTTGDEIRLDGILGATQLNNNTYYVQSTANPNIWELYTDSGLTIPIVASDFNNYEGGGYGWKDADTIVVPNPTLIAPFLAMVPITYSEGNRTWVTVNGYRLNPSQMRFNENNTLSILADIDLQSGMDRIVVTAMVTGASPNPSSYNVNVNKLGVSSAYRTNPEDSSWLIQDFNLEDNIMYFYNVRNILDIITAEAQTVNVSGALLAYVPCDFTEARQVNVYNQSTISEVSADLYNFVLFEGKPAVVFNESVPGIIGLGDTLTLTITLGNIMEIQGERIKFTEVDLINNTVSGITRGIQGTTGPDVHYAGELAYGIDNARRVTDKEYNEIWNSFDITNKGDPLQISTTDAAIFLQSNEINVR